MNSSIYPFLFQEKLSYHSSAILAAYLETITVGYRRRKTMSKLSQVLSKLTPSGRKLLTGTLRLPFPVYPELSVLESLEMQTDLFWTTITPNASVTLETSPLQEIGIRGLSSFSLFPRYLAHFGFICFEKFLVTII